MWHDSLAHTCARTPVSDMTSQRMPSSDAWLETRAGSHLTPKLLCACTRRSATAASAASFSEAAAPSHSAAPAAVNPSPTAQGAGEGPAVSRAAAPATPAAPAQAGAAEVAAAAAAAEYRDQLLVDCRDAWALMQRWELVTQAVIWTVDVAFADYPLSRCGICLFVSVQYCFLPYPT